MVKVKGVVAFVLVVLLGIYIHSCQALFGRRRISDFDLLIRRWECSLCAISIDFKVRLQDYITREKSTEKGVRYLLSCGPVWQKLGLIDAKSKLVPANITSFFQQIYTKHSTEVSHRAAVNRSATEFRDCYNNNPKHFGSSCGYNVAFYDCLVRDDAQCDPSDPIDDRNPYRSRG